MVFRAPRLLGGLNGAGSWRPAAPWREGKAASIKTVTGLRLRLRSRCAARRSRGRTGRWSGHPSAACAPLLRIPATFSVVGSTGQLPAPFDIVNTTSQ